MKKKLLQFFLLAVIISWLVYLWLNDPSKVIDALGVHNSFIILMISSFFGAIVAVPVISVYPTVATFALSGLHPLTVGISASIGISVANILFFYVGSKGRELAETSKFFSKYAQKILRWIKKQPEWAMPIFIFIFVGLTPLPNNLLTASGGLVNYPLKRMITPLLLGNILLMTIIAYFAKAGSSLI